MNTNKQEIIAAVAETIDIPDSAYEAADARYKDLADWFARKAGSARHDPHIYCQGSFRLGTVIRPLSDDEEYDLDLSCELRRGVAKTSMSQRDLKLIIGRDVEAYRQARQIEQQKEEKNRCWRLRYKDDLRFHMDVVPAIPATTERRVAVARLMQRFGTNEALARELADLSVNITDRNDPNYAAHALHWPVSNPEGYARWFVERMRQAGAFLENRAREARAAKVDDLPVYRWKAPLQRVVQLLKRHRDVMFVDFQDAKPISVIITTLAAKAYSGEADLATATERILSRMLDLVNPTRPRVPNPLNPEEDFADKWATPVGQRLQLEANFRNWVAQARADLGSIVGSTDPNFIANQTAARFKARVDTERLRRGLGIGFPAVVTSPREVAISNPARPWRQ